MTIIKVKNSLLEEYEECLLEREELEKEAQQIWGMYVELYGDLYNEIFEYKIECIQRKKTITYIQQLINRGKEFNRKEFETFIHREMLHYKQKLKEMLEETEFYKKAGVATEYDVQRSKVIYRRLAKKIHPDMNPKASKHPKLKELWDQIVAAYRGNDLKTLSECEILVRRILDDYEIDDVELVNLEEKIEIIKEEIQTIVTTIPYIYKEWINDEELIQERKEALEKEKEEYKLYLQELDQQIQTMTKDGGISLSWQMN